MKIKSDSYKNARKGGSKLINIFCIKCNSKILLYQKDGIGNLLRLYLNRIIWPEEYQSLSKTSIPDKIPNLKCTYCNEIIGYPIIYDDGRPAFRLVPSSFTKKLFKN